MKTIKFIPKAVTGYAIEDDEGCPQPVDPTFSGHVVLRVPTFFERQQLKSLVVAIVAKEGEADMASLKDVGKAKVNVNQVLTTLADLVQASIPFYVEVALVNLKTGEKHASFDDLSTDPDADSLLQDVAQQLASGLRLSKNS